VYHVLFLLVMSLTHRWVSCKLAAVLASGMGASPFEGFVRHCVFILYFREIGSASLGLVIFCKLPRPQRCEEFLSESP
jgi:hypothetical protein